VKEEPANKALIELLGQHRAPRGAGSGSTWTADRSWSRRCPVAGRRMSGHVHDNQTAGAGRRRGRPVPGPSVRDSRSHRRHGQPLVIAPVTVAGGARPAPARATARRACVSKGRGAIRWRSGCACPAWS